MRLCHVAFAKAREGEENWEAHLFSILHSPAFPFGLFATKEFVDRLHRCVCAWEHSGVVVSVLDLDLKVSGSKPSPCHCVVSIDKKLFSTLSLSTQVHKWAPATYCWG